MIGVGGSDGVDEPMYLRGRDESGAPRSIWGAIVDTYRNFTTGQILSCGKFLYLMPGDGAATSDGCTWHGTSRSTRAAWTCSASRRSRPRS